MNEQSTQHVPAFSTSGCIFQCRGLCTYCNVQCGLVSILDACTASHCVVMVPFHRLFGWSGIVHAACLFTDMS
jgi:hypothetical protein